MYSMLSGIKEAVLKSRHEYEDGMGTVEVVVITGILLTVALVFSNEIQSFADKLFASIFSDSKVLSGIMR